MTTSIQIEKINYFGQSTNSDDYNAKCLYRKYGKLYLLHVYIDHFNREVFISNNQPKECKVLQGIKKAVNEFAVSEHMI